MAIDFTNKRTLLIGGVIFVALILILSKAGGGSKDNVVYGGSAGPSDAQINAATQLQIANQQGQYSLAIAGVQNNAGLERAALEASLSKYAIDAENARLANSTIAQLEATRLQIGAAEKSDSLGASIAKFQLEQEFALQRNNNDFQLDYAQIAASTSLAMSAAQAQTTRDILTAQNSVDIARIGALRDMSLAESAAQVNIANNAVIDRANLYNTVSNSLPSLKKNNRDDVLQALLTGQKFNENAGANTIGAIGGALGSAAKLFSIF